MRDLLTVTATVCAVSGMVLACGSCLFDKGDNGWLDGFITGALSAAVIALASSLAVALLL